MVARAGELSAKFCCVDGQEVQRVALEGFYKLYHTDLCYIYYWLFTIQFKDCIFVTLIVQEVSETLKISSIIQQENFV